MFRFLKCPNTKHDMPTGQLQPTAHPRGPEGRVSPWNWRRRGVWDVMWNLLCLP